MNVIEIKKDKRGVEIMIWLPMGYYGERIIQTLFSKYGLKAQVKHVWCG